MTINTNPMVTISGVIIIAHDLFSNHKINKYVSTTGKKDVDTSSAFVTLLNKLPPPL